jgi:Fe-S-cluster containining protein
MDAASRLCLSCGLCCNGALFEVVRLQPTDSVKDLSDLGFQLKRKKREPYFPQPCAMLDGCTCTVYAARPQRCRRFECRQINDLTQGSTTEAEAAERITQAKDLVQLVEAQLDPSTPLLSLAERCRQAPANGPHVEAKAELDAFLAEHFLP